MMLRKQGGSHRPVYHHHPLIWSQLAQHELDQGTLATPVCAQHSDACSPLHFDVNMVEQPWSLLLFLLCNVA